MSLVADNIERLTPYQPGKPIEELERELGIVGSIKLASNENPLGPGPRAVEAIRAAALSAHIYPDGGAFRLRTALAEKHGVDRDEVVMGNGSNEVLTLLARTFGPGGNAVISDYAFIAYRLVLQSANVPTTIVPTGAGFAQDLDAMVAACGDETKLVFLANPTNPTGVYATATELRDFLAAVPEHVIVVVDEAYVEYAVAHDYASALEMRGVREQLVVCRTFSKCFGLAGLRVGYGVTTTQLVNYLNRVREPFNTGAVSQAAACAALEDVDHLRRSVAVNEASRELLQRGLEQLDLTYIPSQTNFLLVQTPRPGLEIYDAMLRDGVIIRPLAPYRLTDWIRISLGTVEQMERCVAALEQALQQP